MKKTIFAFLIAVMLVLPIVLSADNISITWTFSDPIGYRGKNITWTTNASVNYCGIQKSEMAHNSSFPINITAVSRSGTNSTMTWGFWWTPSTNTPIGCQKRFYATCTNCTSMDVGGTGGCNVTGGGLEDYSSSVAFCLWNYEADDISDIVTDVVGTGGAEFKTYVAIIILGLVLIVIGGVIYKIKRAK